MKKFIYSSMAVAMLASFAAAQETPWAEKGCVAFVNGTKDYDQNCYNSGLENMKAGTCYTFNTLRGPVPQWVNNQATETWWWVETPCVEAAPVPEPVEGTYKIVSRGCIAFKNGTQDYDKHCYSEGLENMKEGKCYTFNTARGSVPKWINNQASESWWWVEMDCADIEFCRDAEGNIVQCEEEGSEGQGSEGQGSEGQGSEGQGSEGQGVCTDPETGVEIECQSEGQGSEGQGSEGQGSEGQGSEGQGSEGQGSEGQGSEGQGSEGQGSEGQGSEGQGSEGQQETEEVNCSDVANADKEECAQYIQDKCINYVHGAGHYAENCYKSGLNGMEEGKCYAMNPNRIAHHANDQYINGNAFDSHWWVETECEKVYVAPVDMSLYDEVEKGCITYEHDVGGYSEHCYNAGLNGMEEGKCYVLNPDRLGGVDNAGYAHAINGNAYDSWWWVETSCTEYVLKGEPKPEAKPEPKVAAGKIAVADKTLNVVSSTADVKTLRVFDMNGKLLHSESFSGMVKDVDFAKFAGKGVLLVRVTAGNKLVAMQRVSIR